MGRMKHGAGGYSPPAERLLFAGKPGRSAGNQAFQTINTRMASQIRVTTPPTDAMRPRSTVAMCACAAAVAAGGRGEPAGSAYSPARPQPLGWHGDGAYCCT